MINVDDFTGENIKEHSPHCWQIPNHSCIILTIGGSGLGKINVLLNLINHQPDIDKIYLYKKDPCKSKCQLLINKLERVSLKHCDDPNGFIE